MTVVIEGGSRCRPCRPVTPAAVHRVPTLCGDFLGEPFLGNRRLALIEDGTVPCVEVDTMEATRCVFETGSDSSGVSRLARRASGPWLEDREGNRYAVVGQPVTRDGALGGGAFIVGTVPDANGSAACVGASGHDAAAHGPPERRDVGVLEVAGSETNASGPPLVNHVTRYVGTTTLVHPDGVAPAYVDPIAGSPGTRGAGPP